MKNKEFVLFLVLMCSMSIKAQKCLVMFGVNEIVTINPIKIPSLL